MQEEKFISEFWKSNERSNFSKEATVLFFYLIYIWKNEGKGVVTTVSSRGEKSWLTYESHKALPPGHLMTQTWPYRIVIRTDLMKPVTP